MIMEDDDDDWFTIKQLNLGQRKEQTFHRFDFAEILSNDNGMDVINDQMLPLSNVFFDTCHLEQVKAMVDLDGTIPGLVLPNLWVLESEITMEIIDWISNFRSVKVSREKTNILSQSDTILSNSHSPSCEQRWEETEFLQLALLFFEIDC